MKKKVRIIAVLMAFVSIVSLSSCGSSDLIYGSSKKDVFKDVQQTINPREIYDSIEYTSEMFQGRYECGFDDFCKEADISELRSIQSFKDEYRDMTLSTMPFMWTTGSTYTDYAGKYLYDIRKQSDLDWVCLGFVSSENTKVMVLYVYEVKGDRVDLYEAINLKENGEKIEYTLSDKPVSYSFSFTGPYLTLSRNGASVTLKSASFTEKLNFFYGYSLPDSKLIFDLDKISAFRAGNFSLSRTREGNSYNTNLKVTENGTAYLQLVDYDNNEVVGERQFAYFLNSDSTFFSGLILADMDGVYYYTDSITDRENRIHEQELSEEEAKKVEDLFDELAETFISKGINVTVNRVTGEIAVDTAVIFEGDKAELSPEGKAYLDKFTEAYYSVVTNEKYDGFIVGTKVEGHTAPLAGSTYESGLPLSTERAENVKKYIESIASNSGMLQSEGLSNSRPIYNGNGEIDLDACRRVSFKFILNTESSQTETSVSEK